MEDDWQFPDRCSLFLARAIDRGASYPPVFLDRSALD